MAGRHILRRLATVQSALRCSTVLASRGSQLVGMHVKSGAVSRIAASSLHTTRSCWNEHIINIQDEEDFNEKVIKSDKPVIVDFHATWCGPCKLLAPRLEALIASKAGKVIMAKVDIDDNSDLAIRHGVQAVPTVVSFKNGSKVDLFVGVKDDADLTSFINKLTGE